MSYYIKKTNLKKGLYLQIYRGVYDPAIKNAKSTSYRKLGYYDDLVAAGIEDPVAYFQEEVDALNQEEKMLSHHAKQEKIGRDSPMRNAGYFPLKMIMDSLNIKPVVDIYQAVNTRFRFSLYDMISALAYARAVDPCSKKATYDDVLPSLFGTYGFSYDQILEACEFIGHDYSKFIELMTEAVKQKYGINTGRTYFDCTNFYFEIDREDDFRKKGPSKEHRVDPIVGMGLMLDSSMIPIGMHMFPGNQSEKPVLRSVIKALKQQNHIEGRTVHVADKGLNCAENIIKSLEAGDGYIFSRSVKTLSGKEMVWVMLDEDWHEVKNRNGELVYAYKECIDKFPYEYMDEDGIKQKRLVMEKRVLTYSPQLERKHKAEIEKQVLKANSMCASQAKKAEFGPASTYVSLVSDSGKVKAELNLEKVDEDMKLAGLNMLVTSELKMDQGEIYSVYHDLWRIEETFRTLKSELDARPVYLQKTDSIIGHFVINYIAILLVRLLQFKVLEQKFGTEELMHFIKSYRLVKIGEHRYLNVSRQDDFIDALSVKLSIPLNNMYLTQKEIKLMKLD